MGVSANYTLLAKLKQQRGLEGVVLRQWASSKDNTKQNPTKVDV
jgi:hypothetical protein